MEVLSVYRGARISAFKARELTREIQGLPASAALDLIAFSPKKAALLVGKTLKSAIANAENNNELRVDTLVVKEATVGEGPTMKRMKSRARGSSSAIRKRTSHIRIVLSDEIEIPQRRTPKKPGARKKTAKPAAPIAAAAPKQSVPAAATVEPAAPPTRRSKPKRPPPLPPRQTKAPAKPPLRRSSPPTRT